MSPRPIPPQHGDETDLYRQHAHRLIHVLRRRVVASDEVVEDAAAFAWMQLLIHQPDRTTLFAWLRQVAIRRAWDLAERERRDRRLDLVAADHEARHDPLDLDTRVEARQTLAAIARLPELQRSYVTLLISGLSYDEIATANGTSYTSVNKRLTHARKTLRTRLHA